MNSTNISQNLESIISSIKSTAELCGRNPDEIKLCAVSKFHPEEAVEEAINAGQFLFGENRVQEAYSKFTQINERFPRKASLHIIGSLQRNKTAKAVEIASCIQSVDRMELLEEIQKQCAKLSKKIDVFLEIHTGEESKSGFTSEDEVFNVCRRMQAGDFPLVTLKGLMTMAPFTEDESLIRKSFSTLRQLKERINAEFPSLPVTELSMGMSGDYKIAIQEGSTMVRIGTAIFGERDYNA